MRGRGTRGVCPWTPGVPHKWPPTSAFANLQACPRLKDVRFDFSCSLFLEASLMEKEIVLSDERWEQLAMAWSDLVSIWFRADCDWDNIGTGDAWAVYAPRPRATLRTIASFFRYCPNLYNFSIPIHARGEEAKAILKEVSPKQEPTQLDFRQSWIDKEDAPNVAIFLAALSPHPKTDIQIPRCLLSSEMNRGAGQTLLVEREVDLEGQTMEIARRNDWQSIRQLVESAPNTQQLWISELGRCRASG
ncbi:hypothetical protein M407DRAFT_29139 [Tulasnella calospora MUT 4182]|uniref:Uncharacterized protein n=1 Tax=Tulasnella calospora MUT 4182 TaxID=1051891 RepID=A0A0C3LIL8_9AGAM|nr:hypothetical protein M407DRAFT_29139 [Tulasnella calospora MUT 4182]